MSLPIWPAFFDWDLARLQHRDCLPHLRQENALYFVTFRLGDSLPASHVEKLFARRERWLAQHPGPHTQAERGVLHELWTVPIERLLDASHGACVLRESACRVPLEASMRHGDGKEYRLGDFVIMPNHVHVLVLVERSSEVSGVLQAWKSISARRINRVLGRRGGLWQPEPFDHIVRGVAHWKRFCAYIQKNPGHLREGDFTLGRGSLRVPE